MACWIVFSFPFFLFLSSFIEIQFIYQTIHSFEVYKMYIHHHDFRASSSRQKESPYPLAVTPYPLQTPLPESKQPQITLSVDFPFLDILQSGIIYYVVCCDWLLSLSRCCQCSCCSAGKYSILVVAESHSIV